MKKSKKDRKSKRNIYVLVGLTALFILVFVVCASLGTNSDKKPTVPTVPDSTINTENTGTNINNESETATAEATTEADAESKETESSADVIAPTVENAISIAAAVANKTFYIGDTITGSDFTITVTYDNGRVDINPSGWTAVPLELTSESNDIIISYEGLTTVVTVNAQPAPTPVPPVKENPRFVFLGDSRFVALKSISTDETDTFFAEVGEGYYFLERVKETVIADGTPNSVLIIGLGVNDGQWFIPEYIASINDIIARYPGKVYFTTVNPVDEVAEVAYGYYKENATIDNFNAQVTSGLVGNVTVIDTSAYLKNTGCTWADGLHFSKTTNIDVYNYIKESVMATY